MQEPGLEWETMGDTGSDWVGAGSDLFCKRPFHIAVAIALVDKYSRKTPKVSALQTLYPNLNLSVAQLKEGKCVYLLLSERCPGKQINTLHNSGKYRRALKPKSTRKLSFESKV